VLATLFRGDKKPPVRLVVGLNGVDKIGPGDWDNDLNGPSREQEVSIRARTQDVARKLASIASISEDQVEYYSALRRYRLINLLAALIRNGRAGFKLNAVQPRDPFELASSEVRAFANEERRRRGTQRDEEGKPLGKLRAELAKVLSPTDLAQIEAQYESERARPPRLALFGKAGVGKTTTVNNLLDAKWRVSHTIPGTNDAQIKEFELKAGGRIIVVDLPGYGRSIREDAEYETIYKQVVHDCDIVLLVLQANARDMSDDQEMLDTIAAWMRSSAGS
jgi:predicted GTPase